MLKLRINFSFLITVSIIYLFVYVSVCLCVHTHVHVQVRQQPETFSTQPSPSVMGILGIKHSSSLSTDQLGRLVHHSLFFFLISFKKVKLTREIYKSKKGLYTVQEYNFSIIFDFSFFHYKTYT